MSKNNENCLNQNGKQTNRIRNNDHQISKPKLGSYDVLKCNTEGSKRTLIIF